MVDAQLFFAALIFAQRALAALLIAAFALALIVDFFLAGLAAGTALNLEIGRAHV